MQLFSEQYGLNYHRPRELLRLSIYFLTVANGYSAGAFTRGGLLFISLLFNAFQAFGELASTMLGRPIVNKHRAYTFYRPSALWIAQIMVDMAFGAAQILMFSIIVYFMCGLVLDAGAFFTFYLIIITGYLAMTVCALSGSSLFKHQKSFPLLSRLRESI